ncbi:MAG: M48 family metallopeptidase [Deltaproteobacteria bacterium]|nr:M48 family metallopeptidase [Deltaproteobacteria bacterium]
MTTHWFFWLFLAFFILHELWENGLVLLNIAHTKKHAGEIPSFYRDKIEPDRYAKSIAYTIDKARIGLVVSFIAIPILWAAIFSGFFDSLDLRLSSLIPAGSLTRSTAYCAVVGLIGIILKIPVSLYSNFVLEAKYGFNKMTAKTFAADFFKELFLSALLGIPLLYLIFWLYAQTGPVWWLWAFGALFGFQFFVAAVYPVWLAPLFNKFTPLAEGELKASILALAKNIRFKLSGIFTIDGSKRSGHSNAYFAGMGRMRRIVLFDTLTEQMTNREILSVLAHEMGHNIKKHVVKYLIYSFFYALAGFAVLGRVIDWEPLFSAFRAGPPAPHKALVLFGLFAGYFTFWLTPLWNAISRRHEYEADRFSVETTKDKEGMTQALLKLSKENLSNLTPHPLYSFCHYSHPTTLERIQAINRDY